MRTEVEQVASALGLTLPELGALCGVSRTAAYGWKDNIPPRHRATIFRHARMRGMTGSLPQCFLEKHGLEPEEAA